VSEQDSSHAEIRIRACAETGINLLEDRRAGHVPQPIEVLVTRFISMERISAQEYTNACPYSKADLVDPPLDREHAAQFAVMTAENKLEDPTQEFHKSCARCRLSQRPKSSRPCSLTSRKSAMSGKGRALGGCRA
jgi:hypothetical protein